MEIGCGFASSFEAARQAQVAESLGFDYIGFYDSTRPEPDVWLTVADALRATERITVGTYVLIPHLRHPLAQASAIATLEQAPGGSRWVWAPVHRPHGHGPTAAELGVHAPLRRPAAWLLAGEQVEIDGAITQMIHPPGYAPPRPITVPLVMAANGPKGIEVAATLRRAHLRRPPRRRAERVRALAVAVDRHRPGTGRTADVGAGPRAARLLFTLRYHLSYDGFSATALEQIPGGSDWLDTIRAFPEATRHLKVHDRHTVEVSQHDHEVSERHRPELEAFGAAMALTPDQLRARVDELAAMGATRVMGPNIRPDWERGLRSLAPILPG